MAAPNKLKLDYFSFDVDFFSDEKIEAISGEFGIKGEIITVKLLCAIYRNGYFIEWSDLIKMKLLKSLPGVSSDLLDNVINRLVKWRFFDEHVYNSVNVLTSVGIQKRFAEATKRRKGVEMLQYNLLSGVNANINSINAHIYEQSKVNESKVNESKGNNALPEVFENTDNSNGRVVIHANLLKTPNIPTFEMVHEEFAKRGGTKEMAQRFFNKHSATDWYLGGSAITNFRNLVYSFITNWNQNNQGRKSVEETQSIHKTIQDLENEEANKILG